MTDPSDEDQERLQRLARDVGALDLKLPQKDHKPAPPRPVRDRGGCLTAYLLVAVAANVVSLLAVCAQFIDIQTNTFEYITPSAARVNLAFVLVVQVGILACVIALWEWKAWGYYGLVAANLITIVIYLFAREFVFVISGMVGLLILLWLVNPVRHMLE